ncbi:hypothetical protein ACFXDJ_10070 [Streptomyces sp. NPDC059443]|uniref:hypothetical protein n=1 Tax=unclassified Streptomyces TaxID=2593676 RepID=UPI0036C749E4
MRIKFVRTVLAAAAATAALAVSGCSSPAPAPEVAGGDGSGKSKPQDDNAVRRAWVDCMHQQGQNSVEQDKEGNISIPASGTGESASTAAYDAASKVCDDKVPGIHQAMQKNNEKFVEQARAFVACARKNGYADIPDPDPKNGILVFSTASFNADRWDSIQPACGKLPMPGYTIGQ